MGDECSGCSYRTGENLNEGTITYSSIKTDAFGQLCSYALDGQVYAEPLVVTKVNWKHLGTAKTVVYVVTQNDTIYAFDGGTPTSQSCSLLGSLNFFNTTTMSGQAPADCGNIGGPQCTAIKPYVGILGTPVISLNTTNNTGTIYLVTHSQSGSAPSGFTFYHYLHALDITSLTEIVTPVRISDSTGASNFSRYHIQRPGLLYGTSLGTSYVYVAFSMMDGNRNPYPNGAIFSFNASTLASTGYFATFAGTPSHDGGGIWQDGAGLAYAQDNAHSTNYIYFNTGNGVYNADSGGTDYGDSFLKLYQASTTTIGLASTALTKYSFTPADTYFRDNSCNTLVANDGDWDFDSGGVLLIPEHELFDPSLAVSSEKEGGIWFIDRTTPNGHYTDTSCETTCTCSVDDNSIVVQNYWIGGGSRGSGPVVHTTPTFWESGGSTVSDYLYISSQQSSVSNSGELLQYTLTSSVKHPIATNATPVVAVNANSSPIIFNNGVTPTISQNPNDASDAILWALWGDGHAYGSTNPGILYAFDAVTMKQLYASGTCPLAPTTKFSVPAVADGQVYIGTQGPVGNTGTGMFYIYGPGASGSC